MIAEPAAARGKAQGEGRLTRDEERTCLVRGAARRAWRLVGAGIAIAGIQGRRDRRSAQVRVRAASPGASPSSSAAMIARCKADVPWPISAARASRSSLSAVEPRS